LANVQRSIEYHEYAIALLFGCVYCVVSSKAHTEGNEMTHRYVAPKPTGDWKTDFAAWQAFAQAVSDLEKRVNDMRLDRAFKLAASVGIPRNGCALHNASIDTEMRGWCFNNPARLKVAKRAAWLASNWAPSADKAVYRHYPK
jgi:hypothetical protein